MTSAVHKGVQFESRALQALRALSMSLIRVGGKADGGIDLQGWWWLPNPSTADPESITRDGQNIIDPAITSGRLKQQITTLPGRDLLRLRIFAQCKAEAKKIGPNYVREMEGVMSRFAYPRTRPRSDSTDGPSIDRRTEDGAVAVLVSQSPFTKSAIVRAFSSPTPFLLIHLPSSPPQEGNSDPQRFLDLDLAKTPVKAELSGSAFWNPALSGLDGPLRDAFEMRWERRVFNEDDRANSEKTTTGRPGLWFGGVRVSNFIPPEALDIDEKTDASFRPPS